MAHPVSRLRPSEPMDLEHIAASVLRIEWLAGSLYNDLAAAPRSDALKEKTGEILDEIAAMKARLPRVAE